jgi:uncharacterized RDD family membrane protein YckC/predicted Ser/Thr protein kinase
MRPELDETLAAPVADRQVDPAHTATGPGAPATAATGLTPGQPLGHFRIERALGAGGMGEVYLATDLALDRPVAIKVLPAGTHRSANHRDRLVREARAQARITHPNVGHIYFIGEEAGRLYFAMEYVAGETLADRVAAGPLPVDDALSIIRSAALGLREAERHGITHRDIKPSNLMIDSHGMVKLLDFGLAAGALDEVIRGPVAQTSFAGTPLYMAPEQARGEPVDLRADIYALGATLFHLVSGKPPFEADTLEALLSKHSSALRPSVPRRAGQPRTSIAAVDTLIARMMAPAPADRFASYDELIRAIELASAEHMRPAGLWVRAMAALVDVTLAFLIALAVMLPLQYLTHGKMGDVGASVFLALALYQTVAVSRRGHTIGQWVLELEVADTATGGKPSLVRAAIRVVVPGTLVFAKSMVEAVLEYAGYGLDELASTILVSLAAVPAVLLIWASLRSVAKLTVWDKLSRSMVRYRSRRTLAI